MKILVTGNSGYIGKHFVKKLEYSSAEVFCFDLQDPKHPCDLNTWNFFPHFLKQIDVIYHFAATADVRSPNFLNDVQITKRILDNCVVAGFKGTFVFPSSCVVYGEPDIYPTPETYGPLFPISEYGAAKLACEGLITSYAFLNGFKAKILRIANVVGGAMTHGVIPDFGKQKMKSDFGKQKIRVLGDGAQIKSYIYISDMIDALKFCTDAGNRIDVFNVGNEDQITVREIAEMFQVPYELGSGIRGWPGDVTNVKLSILKLKRLGFTPEYSSKEAIRKAIFDFERFNM